MGTLVRRWQSGSGGGSTQDAPSPCSSRSSPGAAAPGELPGTDNGPEQAVNALRDWSCFGGSGTSYIEPGSPRRNPLGESFASGVRDEVLAAEAFDSLLEAKIVIEDRINPYTTPRLHSKLEWHTPTAYARQRDRATNSRSISERVDRQTESRPTTCRIRDGNRRSRNDHRDRAPSPRASQRP